MTHGNKYTNASKRDNADPHGWVAAFQRHQPVDATAAAEPPAGTDQDTWTEAFQKAAQ